VFTALAEETFPFLLQTGKSCEHEKTSSYAIDKKRAGYINQVTISSYLLA
jgi:hypothetical protein